jgi:hypothetical protein
MNQWMTYGGDGSHFPGCEESHWDCRIKKLEAEVERLREAQRWIPVGERLPELGSGGIASTYVEVVYRVLDGRMYLRGSFQYWRDYGWLYEFKNGEPITFEDWGYVVDFWKPFSPLPEPPEADNA